MDKGCVLYIGWLILFGFWAVSLAVGKWLNETKKIAKAASILTRICLLISLFGFWILLGLIINKYDWHGVRVIILLVFALGLNMFMVEYTPNYYYHSSAPSTDSFINQEGREEDDENIEES